MSKLTDFYAHKAALREKKQPVDAQCEQLEDQLLKEELLPELIEQLRTVLSKVKSPLMFSGSYDPNGCLSVSFTRNCIQISTVAPIKPTSTTQGDVSSEETGEETVAEPEASGDEEIVETEPRFTKAKSFQLSAWLPTFNVSNQFSPLPKILGNFHRILFSAPIAMEFAQSIIKPGSVFVGSKCLTLGCRHDQPVGQPLSLALRE